LRDAEYAVSVAAFNGAGWSPFGPVAKIRIADHAPLAPAAPTLTKIREDGVDVHFTRPPAPISTGLLVNPLKARPCGHVYSKASAMSYFKGVGKRCAVFGCDKHLKWSDFVVDEASETALREYYRRQARTRQDSDGHPYGQLM